MEIEITVTRTVRTTKHTNTTPRGKPGIAKRQEKRVTPKKTRPAVKQAKVRAGDGRKTKPAVKRVKLAAIPMPEGGVALKTQKRQAQK